MRAHQELVSLDTELIDAKIMLAQAQLGVAQASLAQMEAGARPGSIAVAEAQLEQATAGHKVALQSLMDAQALRNNPQVLEMQVKIQMLLVVILVLKKELILYPMEKLFGILRVMFMNGQIIILFTKQEQLITMAECL